MSNFRIGQKVVCINTTSRPFRGWCDGEAPTKGAVYTVAAIGISDAGNPGIKLVELPRVSPFKWYRADRFRPVVEKKTDISVFTAMLKETKQPALLTEKLPTPSFEI